MSCRTIVALGLMISCRASAVERPLEARGFHALLIGAASASAADTICVSLAASGGEVDPSADVLRAVRADFPAVVPRSQCGVLEPEPPSVRLVSARLLSDGTVEAIGETIAEHMRRHRCTMAKGADIAACEFLAPEGAEQTGHVPPT